MHDRDSVIDGLNEIMHYDGEQMFYNDIFIRGIADDALALLKKREDEEKNDVGRTAEGGAVGVTWNENKEETIGILESLQAVCNAKADMSIGKGKILWAGYGKATSDAIIMLREQEAVKIEVKKINGNGRCGRCPNCLIELNEMDYPNYCGCCGQAVIWE